MRAAATTEMYSELLEDAIALAHPDRHAAERVARATRVTAELLALRPHVKPKADTQAGDIQFPLMVTGRRLNATGLVVAEPVFLLSVRIDTVAEGASLTLFDARSETNPSTGELRPLTGTRWLAIYHRSAIYARIRGEMVVTFFFVR
jgi:hypothetical protein